MKSGAVRKKRKARNDVSGQKKNFSGKEILNNKVSEKEEEEEAKVIA